MFVHRISYRHGNGDVEEFIGCGLTPSSAAQNSVYCAQTVVLTTRGETFMLAQIDHDTKEPSRERSSINAAIKTRSYVAALL
jgi:hypothetical protein